MTHTNRYNRRCYEVKYFTGIHYFCSFVCHYAVLMHVHDQSHQKKRRKVERYSEVKTTSAKTSDVLLEVPFLAFYLSTSVALYIFSDFLVHSITIESHISPSYRSAESEGRWGWAPPTGPISCYGWIIRTWQVPFLVFLLFDFWRQKKA